MAIFSRRNLQSFLDTVGMRASSGVAGDIVGGLNNPDPFAAIAAEWELVILYALNLNGRIEHHQSLGGTSRPDILFYGSSKTEPEFIGDVVAPSDRSTGIYHPEKAECDKAPVRRIRSSRLRLWSLRSISCPARLLGFARLNLSASVPALTGG